MEKGTSTGKVTGTTGGSCEVSDSECGGESVGNSDCSHEHTTVCSAEVNISNDISSSDEASVSPPEAKLGRDGTLYRKRPKGTGHELSYVIIGRNLICFG